MTEITAKYRAVFCQTDLGREVFADIMHLLGFGKPVNPNDSYNIALYNLSLALWARIGVFSEENRQNVISAIMAVQPKEKEAVKGKED